MTEAEQKVEEILAKYAHIWKTKSALLSWIRGGVRRSLWSKSPIKLEFIKNNRKKIPNPNPKGKVKEVWGMQCSLCGNDFPSNMIDIDHKGDSHALRGISDIQSFIEGIVLVTEDDLQAACKDCHKSRNHQQRRNISFEDAQIERICIDLIKKKLDHGWLKSRGVKSASNQAKRRIQIVNILKQEKEKESEAAN